MKIWSTDEKGWQCDVTIAGKRVRESGFKTKKALEQFIAELRVQAKRGKFGLERDRAQVTVDQLVSARIADLEQTTAGGRQKKKILESFLRALPLDLTVHELRTAHVREWMKVLRRTGLGRGPLLAGSCNRYLAEVSVMLKEAATYFVEIEEDWRPPRLPWQRNTRRGGGREISDEEQRQLLERLRFPRRQDGKALRSRDVVARRDVADCFEIALLTGMRGGEVRQLEWSEVFLDYGEIHLPAHKTKTNTARVVMLSPRAVEILRRRRKKEAKCTNGFKGQNVSDRFSRWVFPNPTGERPRRDISFVVRPIALELGLRYGAKLPDGFTPHSTRHTATTKMLRAGFDLKTVQDVVGHSDKVMSMHYAHSTAESRRRAVESLAARPKRAGSKTPTRQKVDNEKSRVAGEPPLSD